MLLIPSSRWIINSSCHLLHGSKKQPALRDWEVISLNVALTRPLSQTHSRVHHDGEGAALGLFGPAVLRSQQIKSLASPTSLLLWRRWRGCLCLSACSVICLGGRLFAEQCPGGLIPRLKAAQAYILKYSSATNTQDSGIQNRQHRHTVCK